MTDIVERLHQVQGDNEDAREAADEIMRLEARLAAAININRRLVDEIERMRIDNERLRAEIADRDRIMNMSD